MKHVCFKDSMKQGCFNEKWILSETNGYSEEPGDSHMSKHTLVFLNT